MKRSITRLRSGFTLVELLIAIVVIAILASVSVVAYNGLQQRAQRSSVQSQVNQWEKAFKLYIAERGKRPQGQWACIGRTADYPAEGDFPAGACAISQASGSSTWSALYMVDSEGAHLSDQMQSYVSSNVAAGHPVITLNGTNRIEKWRGIVYDDYSNGHVSIVYSVPGDSCVTSSWVTYWYNDGRVCYYGFESAANVPEWE